MRKTIANITLALLLAVPVFSLVAVVLVVKQEKLRLAYQVPFPGDVEDQQNDSDPARDGETDQDTDIVMEKYLLFQVPLHLKQNESRQECLFREHHREVGTPPPRK